MGKLIDLKRLGRWAQRVKDKYFSSPEKFRAGLRAVTILVDDVDSRIPDKYDAKLVAQAKDFIDLLNKGVDEWEKVEQVI